MFIKRFQIGLIHVAVAMTLVPINSTLNRVMIKELALSATLVAILASLPYLLSPIQVVIGAYSDRHPFLGLRRTPYILAGLLLCVLGVISSPYAAYLMSTDFLPGLLVGLLAFGMWGMGYNLSSVSYFSLASEISGEKGRGKTIATMFFMMIVSIIMTAIGISRLVDPYTPQALTRAFWIVGGSALTLGLLGLLWLEPRFQTDSGHPAETYTIKQMVLVLTSNPVVRVFFWYLLLLLAAILGQDVLLEPFAAEAFGLTVMQTTRITSLWGTFVLMAILAAGILEGHISRRILAQIGNVGALVGFLVIITSGFTRSLNIFYVGIILLGFGTGLSTVANLSLMFTLTTPSNVGLYIGAWGFSNSMSRLVGSIFGGGLRDVLTQVTGQNLTGYLGVFVAEACLLFLAILMLRRIDLAAFKRHVVEPSLIEKASLAGS